MDQTRRQFLAETEELIEQIFVDLDGLRENRDGSRQRPLVDGIFRRLHRIKGSAATFGFDGLSEIAHEFESLLSAMRAGTVVADDNVFDTCESAASALSESLSLVASGVIEPSRRSLFERIHAITPAERDARPHQSSTDAILNQLPPAVWQSLNDEEKQRLARSVLQGTHLCVVSTTFDITSFEEPFYSLKEMLARHGEVISSSPIVDAERSDKINFRILFAGNTDLQNVDADLGDFPGVSLTLVNRAEAGATSTREERGALAQVPPPDVSTPVSNFIRTDLDDLDRVISATHELFRTTSKALDLAVSATGAHARDELTRLNEEIRRSFLTVEDELIGLRMVSLGPLLHRAARAGRAAARVSNKEIEFEVQGTTLRLDKLLCDAIADPLVHLVRNSVDHGIESPTTRVESGKRQRGNVRIEAATVGGQTRVRVMDDGRGIDISRVSQFAHELGLVEPDGVVDMDRSLRLIFRPGFSTLATASTISGRGVGLDVVETAVEQVGGEIRVSSEPGRGSIFEIRLPMTFGLMRAAVLLSGGNRYCIDAGRIVTSTQVEAADIETDSSRKSLQSANGTLPLVRLSELLGEPAAETNSDTQLSVITCEFGDEARASGLRDTERPESDDGKNLVGIVVDELGGTEEVLVRNLGHYAGRWYGIAGATELHDGTVALVLDLPRLLNRQSRS